MMWKSYNYVKRNKLINAVRVSVRMPGRRETSSNSERPILDFGLLLQLVLPSTHTQRMMRLFPSSNSCADSSLNSVSTVERLPVLIDGSGEVI